MCFTELLNMRLHITEVKVRERSYTEKFYVSNATSLIIRLDSITGGWSPTRIKM